MRLAEFRSGADPARADHKQNLRQNEIAQCQRLFKGGALLFNVAFCAIEFADHAPNCRACASLAHRKLAGGAPALQLRNNLIRLRFYRRRRFVAKFTVPDFSSRVCDVAARAQSDRSEQHHHDREWHGRFRPPQWNDDCRGA